MNLVFISPRMAVQKGDFLGSGVPYWPIELATLAAFVRKQGDSITFLDLFGDNIEQLEDMGDYYLQGAPLKNYLQICKVREADAFLLYAISYMSHREILSITKDLKQIYPNKTVAILENSQAVTAYSLPHVAKEFFKAGANSLICGEAYFNWDDIKKVLMGVHSSAPNVITSPKKISIQRQIQSDFRYPIPAWDLINFKEYWRLPYSHGPKTPTFFPMLTSRGCPYPCDFCVVPETNNRQWRGNAPEDIVNEILYLRDTYDVHDFQIEDLNPTIQHKRWEKICKLLIKKKANIRFYFVSGTKAETIHLDKVKLFSSAGLRYISISPESGSANLMKKIGKKFNYNHGLALIKQTRKHGIRTQACMLVGHPDEKQDDFFASCKYLRKMVRAGLDEVAVFIISPFVGSKLFNRNAINLKKRDLIISFSPKGHSNYKQLEKNRRKLIRIFFVEKLKKGFSLWLQGYRAFFSIPQTKMENLPKRILFIRRCIRRIANG